MFAITGGNFQALAGGISVANGSVVLALSDSTAIIIATGGAAPASYTFNLDANGQFLPGYTMWGNAELSVAGIAGTTVYHVTIYTGPNGTGSVAYGPYDARVGPASPYIGTLYPDVTVFPLLSTNVVNGVVMSGAAAPGKVLTAVTPTAGDWEFPFLAVDPTVYAAPTPAFDLAKGPSKAITLTAAVTSSTLINGGTAGKLVIFEIIQNATGGWPFVWPANAKGGGIPPTAPNAIGIQPFWWNGTNLYALSGMMKY